MSDPREENLPIREALQKSGELLGNEVSALNALLNRLDGPFRQRMLTLNERIGDIRDEIAMIEADTKQLLREEAKWDLEVLPLIEAEIPAGTH